MSTVEYPPRFAVALRDAASRVFDARKADSPHEPLARQLLLAFFDACLHTGLDRVLAELQIDAGDRAALAEQEGLRQALVARLETIDLDGGGPRNAKSIRLAECTIAALGLVPAAEPDRAISLGDDVRTEVAAALAAVTDVELAAAKLRESVIEEARSHCEERFLGAFGRTVAQLDSNGMQLLKQPKVPLDAAHAIQQHLFDARLAVIARAGRAAVERAKEVLARADAEAAARVDLPITLRLTPRDVAILRAQNPRVPRGPGPVAQVLLDALTELVPIAWRVPERAARPYAASQTFAVGDLVDHPKFGRGTVVASFAQRIEVEFDDGKHTLVHAR